MDWKPDFAHRSRLKTRSYGGIIDLAATVRAGQTADSFYFAVEVTDDAHWAAPSSGLWRGDSVTLLLAEAGGEEVDPTILTVALTRGEPRLR